MQAKKNGLYVCIGGLAVLALVAGIIFASRQIQITSEQPEKEDPHKIAATEPATTGPADADLAAAAATRPALTRPGLMGGACCHMK